MISEPVLPVSPKVGVVLLNWNGGEFTIPCIESLLASNSKPWRILVFDNGSTDGSPDEIAQRFPAVDLVRNPENIGFAGGNNAGIQKLIQDGADLIWVLNNDTLVHPDCLGILVNEMVRDPGIAGATSKILFESPADLIWFAGANWEYWPMAPRQRGLREKDAGQYDRPEDIGLLSGCCMLVRREVFERLGAFNDRYFIYSEDYEWSLRAVRAGLRLRYIPQAVLWHKQHATTNKNFGGSAKGKASPRAEFLHTRNFVWMVRQHADRPWQLLSALGLFTANRLYRAAGILLLGRPKSTWAILNGLRAGLFEDYR